MNWLIRFMQKPFTKVYVRFSLKRFLNLKVSQYINEISWFLIPSNFPKSWLLLFQLLSLHWCIQKWWKIFELIRTSSYKEKLILLYIYRAIIINYYRQKYHNIRISAAYAMTFSLEMKKNVETSQQEKKSSNLVASSSSSTDGQIKFGIYERLRQDFYKPLKCATT